MTVRMQMPMGWSAVVLTAATLAAAGAVMVVDAVDDGGAVAGGDRGAVVAAPVPAWEVALFKARQETAR